jgi:hypothetical protein
MSCYGKHKVNLSYGADLANWTVIFGPVTQHLEVTNCTARRIQKPYFCHDSFKNFAKMTQTCQGAVGVCKKIMTL